MLTADRLLDSRKRKRPRPEGGWNEFVYVVTFGMVNLGDSAKVRERKRLDLRIDKAFEGGTRFVPVLTRKGGVGKTTVTALLGMALASTREDRIIAIDANPDRGTLAERVSKQTRFTVRDVVTKAASITSFSDLTPLVSHDETRLDILASDTDPMLSEAFDENDYNVVADLTARFYSIVLTDCGTGIVHSVMRATLQRADSVVIVSGGSVDEARLASETLTWLEANGYGDLVRNADRRAQHRHAGHQPREARGDRGALPVEGARDRAHPLRPAAGRRIGHRLRGAEGTHQELRRGSWLPS